MRIINESFGFKVILKPYKVIITNLNFTKTEFIHKVGPNWFHKIDPRPSLSGRGEGGEK
jgi:hypothetical protein